MLHTATYKYRKFSRVELEPTSNDKRQQTTKRIHSPDRRPKPAGSQPATRARTRPGDEPCQALRHQEQQAKRARGQADWLQPSGQPRQHVHVSTVIPLHTNTPRKGFIISLETRPTVGFASFFFPRKPHYYTINMTSR